VPNSLESSRFAHRVDWESSGQDADVNVVAFDPLLNLFGNWAGLCFFGIFESKSQWSQ
jgi:hypothetical protein